MLTAHFIVANHIALITSAAPTPAAMLELQLDTKVHLVSANTLPRSGSSLPLTQTLRSVIPPDPFPFQAPH